MSTSNQRVFKTNSAEYDVDQIFDKMNSNLDAYLNWRTERNNKFDSEAARQGIDQMRNALATGDLTMGAGGGYVSSSGTQFNPVALDFLNRAIQSVKPIPKKEREKLGDRHSLRTKFKNRFYGGNDPEDLSMWTDKSKSASDIADMLKEYRGEIDSWDIDYDGSPWSDKTKHIEAVDRLLNNLNDGTVDGKDSADWAALGGDKKFFDTIMGLLPEEKSDIEKEWEIEEKAMRAEGSTEDEIAQAKRDFFQMRRDERSAKYYDRRYSRDFKNYVTNNWLGGEDRDYANLGIDEIDDTNWNGFKNNEGDHTVEWLGREGNAEYADKLYEAAINGRFDSVGSRDGYSNKEILRLYMKGQLELDPEQFIPIEDSDGEVYVKSTINHQDGTAIKYDTKTNKFTKVHFDPNNFSERPTLLRELTARYRKKVTPYAKPGVSSGGLDQFLIPGAKKGAKLMQLRMLRNGDKIQYALSGAELAEVYKKRKLDAYDKSVDERAAQQGKTREQILAGDAASKTDYKGNTILRNISTGFDVVGAAASFIPVIGNAAGAILGTIGTVGNLAADAFDDSVSSKEMWTNLGINAGLTGLMLIPGGLKAAKTAVQVGMPLYAGYNVANNWDRIKELRKKADEGKLSHAERRELNGYYSMASGTVTGVKGNAAKAAKHLGNNWAGKTAAAIADPFTAIGAAKGNAKANAVFKDMMRDTTANKVKASGSPKGQEYTFTDSEGTTFKVNRAQRDAMIAAERKGKAAGWDAQKINDAIGEAWVKHGKAGEVYGTTNPRNWIVDIEAQSVKDVINATTDPTGNVKIGNIEFSKDSVKTLKDTYKTSLDSIKDSDTRLAGLDDNAKAAQKHIIAMESVKEKFADLPEAKEVSVNPNAPIFGMSDAGRWTQGVNKMHVGKTQLSFDDNGISAVRRYLNSGKGNRFDPRNNIGRRNLELRAAQRQRANAYLNDVLGEKTGNWAMRHFNTNWEVAQNMSGIRSKTDDRLDKITVDKRNHKRFMASDAGKQQAALSEYRYFTEEGAQIAAKLNKKHGGKASDAIINDAITKHLKKNNKQVKQAYNLAKQAGFTGTLDDYKASIMHQVRQNYSNGESTSYQGVVNQQVTNNVTKLNEQFDNLQRVTNQARRKGLTGTDAEIQRQLYDPRNKALLDQLVESDKKHVLSKQRMAERNAKFSEFSNTDQGKMYIEEFRLKNGRDPKPSDYAKDVLNGNLDALINLGTRKGNLRAELEAFKQTPEGQAALVGATTEADQIAIMMRSKKHSENFNEALRQQSEIARQKADAATIKDIETQIKLDSSRRAENFDSVLKAECEKIVNDAKIPGLTSDQVRHYVELMAKQGKKGKTFSQIRSELLNKNISTISDILNSTSSRLGPRRTPLLSSSASSSPAPAPASRTYTPEQIEWMMSVHSSKQGGKLEQLKGLRQNFTTDTTNKFAKGGIIKAQNGANSGYFGEQQGDYGGEVNKSFKFNPEQVMYHMGKAAPEALRYYNYLDNRRNNQEIFELDKSIKVATKTANNNAQYNPVTGAFDEKAEGVRQTGELNSQANRMAGLTSNVEAGQAAMLEAQLKGQAQETEHNRVDNTAIRQNMAHNLAKAEQVAAENRATADENMGKFIAQDTYVKNQKKGLLSVNQTDENTRMQKDIIYPIEQQTLKLQENAAAKAKRRFDQWTKDNITDTPELQRLWDIYDNISSEKTEEKEAAYNAYINEKKKLWKDWAPAYYKRYDKLTDGDYWQNWTYDTQMQFAKKGTKIDDSKIKRRAEDLKELRKDIRHSITTNRKALDNLSKATLLSLKKMLDI